MSPLYWERHPKGPFVTLIASSAPVWSPRAAISRAILNRMISVPGWSGPRLRISPASTCRNSSSAPAWSPRAAICWAMLNRVASVSG